MVYSVNMRKNMIDATLKKLLFISEKSFLLMYFLTLYLNCICHFYTIPADITNIYSSNKSDCKYKEKNYA